MTTTCATEAAAGAGCAGGVMLLAIIGVQAFGGIPGMTLQHFPVPQTAYTAQAPAGFSPSSRVVHVQTKTAAFRYIRPIHLAAGQKFAGSLRK